MSDDQSLSTEDLAGRQAPSQTPPTVSPAASDPGQPPATGAVVGGRPLTESDRGYADQGDRADGDHVGHVGHDEHGHDDHADHVDHVDHADHDDHADHGNESERVDQSDGVDNGGGGAAGSLSDDRHRLADKDDADEDEGLSLVDPAQAGQFRDRWSDVQARFVDDPEAAVGSADALVAELMQSLASGFADHKSRLETQWHSGGEVDTEELRLALRRYRSFFHRLLET